MPNPRSGLSAQLGLVDEVTYGVPVVAGMTFEPLVSESLTQDVDRMESAGIYAGRRVLQSAQWALGRIKIGGDIGLELTNKNCRAYFKHMFGAESGSGPYTYTPGDLTGVSFTAQIGKPDTAGVVDPFTYAGCKVASWELAAKEGEIVTVGLTIVAQKEIGFRQTSADGNTTNTQPTITSATAAFGPDDVGKPISGTNIPASTTILSVQSTTSATMSANATGTASTTVFTIGLALASASYNASILPFHYDQMTLTIAGSTVKVKEATFAGDNGLADDRRFLGQRFIDEPLEVKLREYTGTVMPEWTGRTQYQRFVNGLEAALVATFSNGTDTVTMTENVRFDGTTPTVDGTDIVDQSLPFKAIASGADSTAITAVISQA